jgi:hypothetical protein
MLSRRRFLVAGAGAAGAALLAACGSDDGDDGGRGGSTTAPDATSGGAEYALAAFAGGDVVRAGVESRFPFGLADSDGLLPTDASPEQLTVTVRDDDGAAVGEPAVLERRAEGLTRPYYALRATFPAAGIYDLEAAFDGGAARLSLQVPDPAEVGLISPGQKVPAVATPTVDDAQGVSPICTNEPPCPLHEVSLDAAVAAGERIALLVSTPRFCKVAICGPVLDVLLGAVDAHPEVRFLHAEVYRAPETSIERVEDLAPVMTALSLTSEPVLVLIGADGTVVERLDSIYDAGELEEALARLG